MLGLDFLCDLRGPVPRDFGVPVSSPGCLLMQCRQRAGKKTSDGRRSLHRIGDFAIRKLNNRLRSKKRGWFAMRRPAMTGERSLPAQSSRPIGYPRDRSCCLLAGTPSRHLFKVRNVICALNPSPLLPVADVEARIPGLYGGGRPVGRMKRRRSRPVTAAPVPRTSPVAGSPRLT